MQVPLRRTSQATENIKSHKVESLGGDLTPFTAEHIVKAARPGIPDHLELLLSKEEQEANKAVMICCSGSKQASLTLGI
jgi:hypothetical protein